MMTSLRFAILVEVVSDKPPRKSGLVIGAIKFVRDCICLWFW